MVGSVLVPHGFAMKELFLIIILVGLNLNLALSKVEEKTVLLQNFEEKFGIVKFPKDKPGTVDFSKEWRSDGERSIRIDPQLGTTVSNVNLKNWMGYSQLRFHISCNSATKIALRISDQNSKGYNDDHMDIMNVDAGEQIVEVNLTKEMWRGRSEKPYLGTIKTPLDLSAIKSIAFVNGGVSPLFLDQLELVQTVHKKVAEKPSVAPPTVKTALTPTTPRSRERNLRDETRENRMPHEAQREMKHEMKHETTLLLQDFENEFSISKYPKDSPKTITFSKLWKSDGVQSLRIEESISATFEIMTLKDWTGYSKLRFYLSNTSTSEDRIMIQLKDGLVLDPNKDTHKEDIDLILGDQKVEIDLTGKMWRGDIKNQFPGEVKIPLDPSKMKGIIIYNYGSAPIFIDQFELVK